MHGRIIPLCVRVQLFFFPDVFLKVISYYFMHRTAKSILYLVPFYLPHGKLEIVQFKSMDQFCYERRFSFWFPNAITWLGCRTFTYRRYFMHFSSRTCEFVLLVMYEFLPLVHMSATCVQAHSWSLTHWACACALVILSFIYHNAERSLWYQLLSYRWFFASSTLQLFALQMCIRNCILVNYVILDELALWQICDLFSSWPMFFCWLLLLNPNWIDTWTYKEALSCTLNCLYSSLQIF